MLSVRDGRGGPFYCVAVRGKEKNLRGEAGRGKDKNLRGGAGRGKKARKSTDPKNN